MTLKKVKPDDSSSVTGGPTGWAAGTYQGPRGSREPDLCHIQSAKSLLLISVKYDRVKDILKATIPGFQYAHSLKRKLFVSRLPEECTNQFSSECDRKLLDLIERRGWRLS